MKTQMAHDLNHTGFPRGPCQRWFVPVSLDPSIDAHPSPTSPRPVRLCPDFQTSQPLATPCLPLAARTCTTSLHKEIYSCYPFSVFTFPALKNIAVSQRYVAIAFHSRDCNPNANIFSMCSSMRRLNWRSYGTLIPNFTRTKWRGESILSTDGQGCRPVGYPDTLADAVLLFHRALAPVASAFSTEAENLVRRLHCHSSRIKSNEVKGQIIKIGIIGASAAGSLRRTA
jgi:hypothetical protein